MTIYSKRVDNKDQNTVIQKNPESTVWEEAAGVFLTYCPPPPNSCRYMQVSMASSFICLSISKACLRGSLKADVKAD